jgi:tetratricopeptide (TPR) repeat protein
MTTPQDPLSPAADLGGHDLLKDVSLNPERYVRYVRLLYDADDWVRTCELAERLSGFLGQQARWRDWESVSQLALGAAKRLDDPQTLAWTHGNLGHLLQEQGRWSEAIPHHEQARRLYNEAGNPLWAAIQTWALAEAARSLCHWDSARDGYRQARQLFGQLTGTPWEPERPRWDAIQRRGLADLAREGWQWPEALNLYEETLADFRSLEEDGWLAWTLRAVAGIWRRLGDFDAARDALRQATRLFHRLDHPGAAIWTRHERAVVDRDSGHLDAALDGLTLCVDVFETLGMHQQHADSLRAAGVTLRLMGRPDDSKEALRNSFDEFRLLGSQRWSARALSNLGQTFAAAGDLTHASGYWNESLMILDDLQVPERPRLRRWLADPSQWACPGDGDRNG